MGVLAFILWANLRLIVLDRIEIYHLTKLETNWLHVHGINIESIRAFSVIMFTITDISIVASIKTKYSFH